ncbi:MAG: hypothetical protein AUK47_08350 [Deltaproteobacteria bacterium CG2_30_63_29]|nr:MAG: hypothetical protein AUK47_08350 [Deltaproteobacteria bacterium CG2_30_63_29]PJB41560.1 MAG: hypothetical protein CO108_13010 [Deltaproteobacteria bacterium CG_4_9_14_3_um_filter_63_12]
MSKKEDSPGITPLNELGDMGANRSDSEPAVAKVKKRSKVKEQNWMSDDRADNLLAGILGEASAEAEAEKLRLERERKAKEERERAQKADVEAQRQKEAAERVAAERERQTAVEQRRTQMLAAIERKKKIDSGEINEEEERRRKEEEIAAKQHVEDERRRKESELNQAQSLIQQQQAALHELANRPVETFAPPKSNTGLIIGLAAVVLIVGGGAVAFLMLQEQPSEALTPYAMESNYPAAQLTGTVPSSMMSDVGLDVVSQSAGQEIRTIAGGGTGEEEGKGTGRKTPRKSSGNTKKTNTTKKVDKDFNDLGKGKGSNVLGGGKGGGIVF